MDFRASVLHVNARSPDKRSARAKISLSAAAIALAALAAAAAWFGAKHVGDSLYSKNELFTLRKIVVKTSGEVLTRENIVEYAQLDRQSNIFGFDIAGMRADFLARVPRVKDIKISRILPDTICIEVRERRPMARLDMGGYSLSVDEEGCVLGVVGTKSDLPAIRGHDAAGIKPGGRLHSVASMNAIRTIYACSTSVLGRFIRIAAIDIKKNGELELMLADGGRAPMTWKDMDRNTDESERNMEKKLTKLAMSLQDSSQRGKTIAWIDMRLEHNIPAIER